ncbi:hypothetical protein JYU34_015528 [Plutella xylostella]|uniref:Uncharacterized protein n=1 Tax=Plutella xylostella TaxID=51655 RepID=A0ABQ7QB03_PLUXY|nr:uncharacterized protein LOC119691619 [Plutella xylostella]KAG7301118.1 hypothetical protein JYU34_015528 [Plutella xylostella]
MSLNWSVLTRLIIVLSLIIVNNYAKQYYIELERSELASLDTRFLEYFNVSARRRARRGPVVLAGGMRILYPAQNNVTLRMLLLEKHKTGYRPTPLDVKYKLCELRTKDKYFLPAIQRFSPQDLSKCPFLGVIEIKEMTFEPKMLPLKYFPYQHVRLDLTWTATATGQLLLHYSVYLKISEQP